MPVKQVPRSMRDEAEQQAVSGRAREAGLGALNVAMFAQVLAVLYGAGGAVAGVLLAAHTRDGSHPFVAVGVGVAVGAALTASVVALLATYVRFRVRLALDRE